MPSFSRRLRNRIRRFWRRRPGSPYRSRGLDEFEALFGEGSLDRALSDLRGRRGGRPVRALEFGCGEGRLLLELLARHPDIEAHGVNRERWRAMRGDRSFARTARRFGLPAPNGALPRAWFLDADREPLPFQDASIDLIVSQRAIHYVADKARLLEEFWRILSPGGLALLHVDSRHPEAPDFLQTETPRFVVRDGDGPGRLGLGDVVRGLDPEGKTLSLRTTAPDAKGRRHVLLTMRKSARPLLALPLELERGSTINLFPLRRPGRPEHRSIFWGRRSVYRLRAANREEEDAS